MADPLARRGAVFVAAVLLALVGGYFIGRSSVAPVAPAAPAAHVHEGGGAYTMALESTVFPAGAPQELRFTVRGPDGAVVTRFIPRNDKQMHVIVVRTDLTAYQHVHPVMSPRGGWSVPLSLPTPGSWRVYGDFSTTGADGNQVDDTVAGQLSVPGEYTPAALPPPATTATVDGIAVTLDGIARPGGTAPLTITVSPGTLDRYLGAFGHLAMIRTSDLAYVHVHPEDQLYRGAVRFWVTPPGPGVYRAFFDFQIAGIVRTAAFTIAVDNK